MAVGFIKNMKAELKKVVWPTKKQLMNNTLLVIVLIVLVAAVVLSIDFILQFGDNKLWEFISGMISSL